MSDRGGSTTGRPVRRERALAAALMAAGAVLVLVACSRPWTALGHAAQQQALGRVPHPATTAAATGARSLIYGALAGLLAVFATRGWPRVLVGGVVTLLGLGAAAVAAVDLARPATQPSGAAYHMTHTGWPLVAAVGAALVAAGGAVVVARGRSWATMSAKYDAPGARRAAPKDPEVVMWEALDMGADPTAGPREDGGAVNDTDETAGDDRQVSIEYVVLLDDHGRPIGTAPKAEVHHAATPLHLAFSCWVLDEQGRMLLTRRAEVKRTWPGVWTNAFCGHPAPGEAVEDAVRRRAGDELGTDVLDVEPLLPDFRYRAVMADGTVENEVCPVFVAHLAGPPSLNPDEVAELRWLTLDELRAEVARDDAPFSPWLLLQLDEVQAAGGLSGIRESRREPGAASTSSP